MGETSADGRPREDGEAEAAEAAVQVQAELGTPAGQAARLGRQQFGDIRIALEDGGEGFFDYHGELEVRPAVFEKAESRGRQHTIAQ